jgi:hypothetical protein
MRLLFGQRTPFFDWASMASERRANLLVDRSLEALERQRVRRSLLRCRLTGAGAGSSIGTSSDLAGWPRLQTSVLFRGRERWGRHALDEALDADTPEHDCEP